jgi:RNA polymerase sigma-70 factor (ECF subfamily)
MAMNATRVASRSLPISPVHPAAMVRPLQTDLDLIITRARQGDQEAMETLIRRYQGRIAGFVASLVNAGDQIEDLCQTIFVKMVVALPDLKSTGSFESWIFRIARNASLDFARRLRWRRLFVPYDSDHDQIAAQDSGRSDDLAETFGRALQKLPLKQRELIVLMQDNEWSYEELAKITKTSLGSVRSRLFRARDSLKRLMNEEQSEP